MSATGSGRERLCVLFTCVGRRVELLQAFRAAAARLNVDLRIVATENAATAPALPCADEPVLVPSISDDGYLATLLELVRRHGVHALIPTIDTDLLAISARRGDFEAAGCIPLIAERSVVAVCRDKMRTYEFLRAHGIDTPTTYSAEQVLGLSEHRFPYFLKPRYGSSSHSVFKIEDESDLDYHLQKAPDPIVQEYVDGDEYTLDVYVGLTGEPHCVVPRRRIAVRAGEVSKGIVEKDRAIMQAGRRVVEALGPSLRGLVTIQCIRTRDGRIRFIEINPRFGGGAPLGIAAGADYPGWLLQELLGRRPQIAFDGFEHGLCMLLYDWSAFVPYGDDLRARLGAPRTLYPPFEPHGGA